MKKKNIGRREAAAITKAIGMAVEDDLGFTVCGGELTFGRKAPKWISALNGEDTWTIARRVVDAVLKRNPGAYEWS